MGYIEPRRTAERLAETRLANRVTLGAAAASLPFSEQAQPERNPASTPCGQPVEELRTAGYPA